MKPINERTDFIYIDNNTAKFYKHPTVERLYCSTDGQIAQTRINGDTYLLNQYLKSNGYFKVSWTERGRHINHLAHRLILSCFKDKPNDTEVFECNHILPNSRNVNKISNLEWVTKQENLKKRDESGILLKETVIYNNDNKTVTKYASRGLAAEATDLQISNLTTAIKYGNIIRNKYCVTDIELTTKEYADIFKIHQLKLNRRKRVIITKNGVSKVFDTAIDAAKFIGCAKGGVADVCRGKGKTIYGWSAEYV